MQKDLDPTTQTSTPKFVEEVAVKVMKVNKVVDLLQTMAMNTLKNRLAIGEKEKAMLQEELDKERDFQKGYKHNVEIQRKNKAKAKHKIKMFIKKLQDKNEEFKGSTTRLKPQDEEQHNSKQKA